MAIDYDVRRTGEEEEDAKTVNAAKNRRSPADGQFLELDDADEIVGIQLLSTDLSGAEVEVVIVPVQADEFTCVSCFLVKHRSQIDHTEQLGSTCLDCAA
ncbi:DUF4193 family protein [Rathayibacter soli]|uniref:DUF4193 family protein n=1 Tax=Rathayibacter soli TaxID=3144168 RepID=UPI0027E4643E|nr:DUF4193 family protein [Glaciibacter superstes]